MAKFLESLLKKYGATDIVLKDVGMQSENLPLPPVVLARFGNDPSKKTILVYGHYDVQPALQEDGWNTDPFTLIEQDDCLYGRGSTDDKGPVLEWINIVQAHQELGLELPVNLWCCFEGMEESGSEGLEELIEQEKNAYFKGVDAVCISDNYWLGTKHPVLTYGLRGCNYYEIIIEGPGADLHSGVFGGVAHEPMIDLSYLFTKLVDPHGKILIPGVYEMVAPFSTEEQALYDNIHFKLEDMEQNIGAKTTIGNNIKKILQNRWRYPSVSIHGVEGAFYQSGAKTVIPAKVSGKFSVRTVPNMDSETLNQLVFNHVKAEFSKLGSKNTINVKLTHDGSYWVTDPNNWSFRAARKATKTVWGVDPDFTREGGSIPITLSFQNILNTSVVLLPVGRGDDGAHSTNEKLNISNYIQGAKTLGAYLHYMAEESKD